MSYSSNQSNYSINQDYYPVSSSYNVQGSVSQSDSKSSKTTGCMRGCNPCYNCRG